MSDKKRIYHLNHCHHIQLRGVGGRALFNDDEDRVRFCLFLQTSVETCVFHVHAFCFMTHYMHLVVEPTSRSLHEGISCLLSRYTHYFNQKYASEEPLFQDPYQAILIEDETYLIRIVRHIHLDPVRVGVTCTPERYIWSSHPSYLGFHPLSWLTEERVLSCFGEDSQNALYHFVEYVRDWIDADQDAHAIGQTFLSGVLPSPFSRDILFSRNR